MEQHMAVGACIVKNGKVLLMHHTKLDKWLFPGGHVDGNETPDSAVIREVKEETELDFEFIHFSPLEQADEEIKQLALPFHANIHNVGDHNHFCQYYLGTVDNEEFSRNHESKDMGWFTAEEIQNLENIPPGVRNMALYAISLF